MGVVVLVVGPIACLLAATLGLVNRLDLDSARTIDNGARQPLHSGMSYVVATSVEKPGTKPCWVRGPDEEKRELESGDDSSASPGAFFVTRGFTHVNSPGIYQLKCPGAEGQLVLLPVRGNLSVIGLTSSLMVQGAGACVIIGLLMVVFRKKLPVA
jgi:hypothetical protein